METMESTGEMEAYMMPEESNAIEPYNEERPEAEEELVAPEWPPYCNPAYIMPATIQVYIMPHSIMFYTTPFISFCLYDKR